MQEVQKSQHCRLRCRRWRKKHFHSSLLDSTSATWLIHLRCHIRLCYRRSCQICLYVPIPWGFAIVRWLAWSIHNISAILRSWCRRLRRACNLASKLLQLYRWQEKTRIDEVVHRLGWSYARRSNCIRSPQIIGWRKHWVVGTDHWRVLFHGRKNRLGCMPRLSTNKVLRDE